MGLREARKTTTVNGRRFYCLDIVFFSFFSIIASVSMGFGVFLYEACYILNASWEFIRFGALVCQMKGH